ncbi:MAG: phospholipase D family protein [Clostridia bacterium]|nr:phospholipase D family protein [Clostridia bacterium]
MKSYKSWLKLTAALVSAVFLFLILGACAPFMAYPEIKDTSDIRFFAEKVHAGMPSADRAMILETNISALDERIRLMNRAEKEIIITSYDIRDGESTRDILSVALKKADEGVSVRILTDGLSAFAHMNNGLFKAISAHPNIEIRVYNYPSVIEPWKFMGRMHDKYLIADDIGYIIGGRNMFDYFIGDYPTEHRSHDREVFIYNASHGTEISQESSVFHLRGYFEEMWNSACVTSFAENSEDAGQTSELLNSRYETLCSSKAHLFTDQDFTEMTFPTEGVHLISNPTGLYAKEPVVFQTLYELMALADREVIIHSPYAVLNGYMQDALKKIASKVSLTLMINARENGDNIVASSDYTYNRDKVLDTGARILEYAGGESYHGKSIAIDDDISVIGSFNMDLRSAYVDTELMLVIKSEEINMQLRKNMAELHEDCAEMVSEDESVIPENLSIPDAPFWKKVVWHVLGLVLQPVRMLV